MNHIYSVTLSHLDSFHTSCQQFAAGVYRVSDMEAFTEAGNIYKTLDASAPQIRLLQVEKSQNHAEIVRCHLSTYHLEDAPDYIALSYVWGDPLHKKPVFVNDQLCSITSNLDHALRTVRDGWTFIMSLGAFEGSELRTGLTQGHMIGPIWVDALCINQADLEERARQVQLMGEIYSKARLVLGWVCADSEEISRGTQVIKRVDACVKESLRSGVEDWEELCLDLWIPSPTNYTLNDNWNAVLRISELPYWTRIWILQEITLSKSAAFLIGSSIFALGVLQRFLYTMRDAYPPREPIGHSLQTSYLTKRQRSSRFRREQIGMFMDFFVLGPVDNLRQELSENGQPSLIDYLRSAGRMNATDPRDKLFGLAGITKSAIVPDYKRSTVDLYTELASTYVLDNIDDPAPRRYNILQISGTSLWAVAESKGPSWVPYWPALGKQQYLWVSDLASRSSWFSADHKAPSSDLSIHESKILRARTVICDTVQTVAPHTAPSRRREVLRAVARLMMTEGFEVTKSLFIEFVTCIMCGCNRDHMKRLDRSEAIVIADELIKDLVEETIKDSSAIPAWVTENNEDVHVVSADEKLARRSQGSILFTYTAGYNFGGQRFAQSRKRLFAMLPLIAESGDLLCVISGCRVPMLIRPHGDHHVIVGSCYVQGLMDGESADMLARGDATVQELEIH
jgi:Heterokaryon incompatibility protein (HET)